MTEVQETNVGEFAMGTGADLLDTAGEAVDVGIKCATSGFVPINPVDWVISYIPNMALAVGIIIATILMFICLGFLFSGGYQTAMWLFVGAAGVALLGYGVATALTWVPLIGGKWACRKGAGGMIQNLLNRGHNFAAGMKNMPVVWPVTWPLGTWMQMWMYVFSFWYWPLTF